MHSKPLPPHHRATITRDANRRAADQLFASKGKGGPRPRPVIEELAEAAAVQDAKTARLRALRLEKERQDAETVAADTLSPLAEGTAVPPAIKAKRIRRIVC